MSGHSKWRDIKHKAAAAREQGLEWMVSLDTGPAASASDAQVGELVDELEVIATPEDGSLGTTITVLAPTREEAAERGRERFAAALRAAGVDAEVVKIEVGTYDDE